MSDERAEQALREALGERAEQFEPGPLSVPTRRRRWPVIVAAAAAVVIVVTGSVLVLRDHDTTAPSVAHAGVGPVPDARTVSYLDVEVDVPASWGDGYTPGSDWCANDGRSKKSAPAPYVGIHASGGRFDVLCRTSSSPAPVGFPVEPERLWAPHVDLLDQDPSATRAPDGTSTYQGWTLTVRTVGEITVSVLTDAATEGLAAPIAASARQVDQDALGCDTTSPAQATGAHPPAFDVADVRSVSSIAVCEYQRFGTDGPGLEGSRVITGKQAQQTLEAIQAAPLGGGPDTPEDCLDPEESTTVLVARLFSGDEHRGDLFVHADGCAGNGIDDGTHLRTITRDDCRPLWGGRVVAHEGPSQTFGLCHPL